MSMRGRYAPTPSGYMHLGNARTALIAWLQSRSAGGTFLLRMEDIDKPRCKPEYAAALLQDLHWLGLDWDEGPDIGGPYAPYTQSERLNAYEEALTKLSERGWLYPCTCTRAKLQAIASAPHGLSSEGPSYPGICKHNPPAAALLNQPHSLRFALPDRAIQYEDGHRGMQFFAPGAGGDFVVKRSDGIVGYQLAVVVDDAAMAVTDVLRGDDLLDSTPRQLLLFEALGCTAPRYAHVPLLYGSDGRRLSKRHGSVTIRELAGRGVPAERIVGYLAYWSGLIDRPEPAKPHELISAFRLSDIPAHAVVVTAEQLNALIG